MSQAKLQGAVSAHDSLLEEKLTFPVHSEFKRVLGLLTELNSALLQGPLNKLEHTCIREAWLKLEEAGGWLKRAVEIKVFEQSK